MAENVPVAGRRFGDGHVLRDHRLAHFLAELLGEASLDLEAHVAAPVEAGQQVTALDAALEHRLERLQGTLHLQRTAQGEKIRRNRHQQPVGGEHRIQGEHAEEGTAVNHHAALVAVGAEIIKALVEAIEDVRPLAEDRIDFDEFGMGGYEATDAFPVDFQIGQRPSHLVESEDAVGDSAQSLAMYSRKVRLRVEVDQEDRLSPPRHGSGEVERSRRLADAAFLVENGDASHVGEYIYKQAFFT